jgi:hypothetical protein
MSKPTEKEKQMAFKPVSPAIQTIIIWSDMSGIRFYVVKEDFSHLHGKYINGSDTTEEEEDQLNDLLYTEDGKEKQVAFTEFPYEQYIDGGTAVIVAGFFD